MSRNIYGIMLVAIAVLGVVGSSEAKNPFSNTPFDPGTWKPPVMKPKPQSNSGLMVVTESYEIRSNGQVWRFYSSNTSSQGSWTLVTNLSPTYDNDGRARFYYSRASNSPLRAPQYDKSVQYRDVTDASNRVFREKFVGGQLVSSTFIGYKNPPPVATFPSNPNPGTTVNPGVQGGGQPVAPGVQIAIEILKALQDE